MPFTKFQEMEYISPVSGRLVKNLWCTVCDAPVRRHNAHLSHCMLCDEHHTNDIACQTVTVLLEADKKFYGKD